MIVQHDLQLRGSDGLTLVARASGDPAAPPVLLLHGAGQSRHAWRHTATALSGAGWYTLAMDHRGHGDSDWPTHPDYEFEHFANDVERILSQLSAPPVVIGASLGGIAALVAQGRTTEQLYRALILVDVTPTMDFRGVRRIVGFMAAHPDGFDSLEDASHTIAAYTGRPRPERLDGLRRVLRPDDAGRWRWHWDGRFLANKMHVLDPGDEGDEGALAAHANRVRAQLDTAAEKVRVPTLIIRGARSELVTPEAVRALQRIIPGSRYVDVADAGHMVAGDDNDHFTAAVFDFLAELEPPPTAQ